MDVIVLLKLRDGWLCHSHFTDQRRLGEFHM